MNRVAVIDSGLLGEIIKRHPSADVTRWIEFMVENEIVLRIPEIIDYEIRRELILQDLKGNSEARKSLSKLNRYRQTNRLIPLEPSITFTDACELWANLRFNSQPTADIKNIDVDVILVTQALSIKKDFDEIIIVTGNLSDLRRFSHLGIKIWDWKQALHDCKHNSFTFHQELS